MKSYNFFYYGTPITRAQFLEQVPCRWEDDVNEYGEYSYGGYRAVERNDED